MRSRRRRSPVPAARVADELTQLVATIGENMNIRRARVLSVGSGVVATYVHNTLRPGLGKIGVLVAIEGTGEMAALETLGRQVGMHIAASTPEAVDIDGVDPAALAREKAVLIEQARVSRAGRTTSSRRWSRAASANSTRRSCCSSRSGCMTARAG